jgi:hypothetical protein
MSERKENWQQAWLEGAGESDVSSSNAPGGVAPEFDLLPGIELSSASTPQVWVDPKTDRKLSSPAGFDTIRTETVLSRFPVHNLAKKGNVDIHILRRNDRGEVEIRWEVSFNSKYGQPRQLAYKLDTLVVNRRLEEEGRPLPKLIRLGSLREIAERLELGSNTNIIKRALRQNASAFITVRVNYTNLQGVQKTVEADFTRYSVIFTGEKLPDKRRADAVYLNLHDVYWSILNEAPWRPLDYDYLKALGPAAQRFYEIVSYRFYNAFRFRNLNASKIAYSEYCLYSAQQRYFDYEHFKKQMYKVHLPHRKSGYLAEVRYQAITDAEGRPDWMMWYVPGPKARREFEVFTGLPIDSEPPRFLEEPAASKPAGREKRLSNRRASNPESPSVEATTPSLGALLAQDSAGAVPQLSQRSTFVAQLKKRGVSERQAEILVDGLKPDQNLLEQLEWADWRIASEPSGTFRNPPGFYVSVVRDNTPVPDSFESTNRREHRESMTPLPDPAEFEEEWLDYKSEMVTRYIASIPPSDYEAMVDRQQREYVRQYRAAEQWPAETLRQTARNAVAVQLEQELGLPGLEEYAAGKRKAS